MLESKIDDNALLYPASTEVLIDFPNLNSSLVLSNMRTLASTAIPMVSINPAIPASVNTTPNCENTISTKLTYKTIATEAIIPGTL